MSIEFEEENIYTSREVLGGEQEPRMTKLYQKLGFTEKGAKTALLITPIICFGLSIAILLWYFL